MQNTKMNTGEYILFSVPVEMLEEAGVGEESIVQMSAGNGKIDIERKVVKAVCCTKYRKDKMDKKKKPTAKKELCLLGGRCHLSRW